MINYLRPLYASAGAGGTRDLLRLRSAITSTPPSTIAPPSQSFGPTRSCSTTMASTVASYGASSRKGVTRATGWRCSSL